MVKGKNFFGQPILKKYESAGNIGIVLHSKIATIFILERSQNKPFYINGFNYFVIFVYYTIIMGVIEKYDKIIAYKGETIAVKL